MKLIRRGRKRVPFSPTTALLFCAYLCFLSILTNALLPSSFNGDSCSDRPRSSRAAPFAQGNEETQERVGRGFVGGPGSYPPRCTLKCGECRPCSPVHVPVPPGTPVIAEYYPEAWRCKCGNNLFMP